MKVCTDACLFGAWIPANDDVKNMLDIGAGTGLLSLIMAQKTNAAIDAVEIDEAAFFQAKENIANSTYKDRITVLNEDFKYFNPSKKYDLIITNPPFYEHQVHSADERERTAKHAIDLTLENLLTHAAGLLSENGKLAILLPYYRKEECLKYAQLLKLYPEQSIHIRQTPRHDFFRYAVIFSFDDTMLSQDLSFSIKNEANQYSETSIALLNSFYLYL